MSVIGRKLRLHNNHTGLGVRIDKWGKESPIGRATYPAGTNLVVVNETDHIPSVGVDGTLTCRVLGVSPEHYARFNRRDITFTEIK